MELKSKEMKEAKVEIEGGKGGDGRGRSGGIQDGKGGG